MAVARSKSLTNGSLWDKILLFALPIAFTGILQQLFNSADMAIVGNFVGTEAQAAVGSNAPLITLLINMFMGMAIGTNVVVSTAIGRGDKEAISKGVHTSILMAVIGGLVVMALGEIFSKPILSLLNIPDDVFDMALTYLRIYILGMPMFFIYNFEAAIFRSNGDSKTPLIVLAMSGLLNVILNVVFVVVIGMKVEGVAIATIVSNAVSTIVLFIILLNTKQVVRITFKKIRIDVKTMWEIIKIGVPSSIQSCMYSVANIILQTGTNSLGSVAMAGASTANNITAFAWFTLSSFGQASTTFTGQNNGAGNMKRCKKSLYLSLGIGMIVLVVVASLLMLFDDTLFAIFNKDPAVWEYARIGMYYILLSYPCSLIQDTCSGYLRGFGHSFIPAVIAIMCICVFRILWIVFVFPMYNTYSSIAIVYPITLTLTAIATVAALLIMRPAKKRELELEKLD